MFATCSWPSLCEQSEGDEDCGGQARAESPSKSWPEALAMFATCSWPSLCEQSELQCWRRNRRLCGPAQFSAARALPPNLILSGFLTPYLSEAFAARTCSEGLRRSTVAHFARKVRGTNIAAAKHGLKIQQSHGPTRWPYSLRVRGPHFASKVSYNAGAATDDYAGQQQISAARALSPNFNISF